MDWLDYIDFTSYVVDVLILEGEMVTYVMHVTERRCN